MDPVQRRKAARRVEIGGQVGAAVAGTGLGAAKLRDAYKEDHKKAFGRGLKRLHTGATRLGASGHQAARLVSTAHHGKPHFAQIAAGATAAAAATGAQRYQTYSKLKDHRSERTIAPVTKSAFGVDL